MNRRSISQSRSANQTSNQDSRSANQPSVAQPKTALSPAQRTPTAPPVYRPQPIPKVLQRKSAFPADTATSSRIAPPGNRLEVKRVASSKMSERKDVPRVFAPNPTPKVLQLKSLPAASKSHKSASQSNHLKISGRGASVRQRISAVIQRADKGGRSSSNVNAYSSLALSYTAEEIEAAQQEALGQNVHGHQTGGSGSGVSQQTKTDMSKVVDVLHKHKAAAHKAKKAVSHDRAPMSGFSKAVQKAEKILEEQGKEGLGDFIEYLDTRQAELGLTEEQESELIAMFT